MLKGMVGQDYINASVAYLCEVNARFDSQPRRLFSCGWVDLDADALGTIQSNQESAASTAEIRDCVCRLDKAAELASLNVPA